MRRKGTIDQKKKKNLEDAIVKYLIKSNQPFEHVENSAFREVLFVADPNLS